MSTPYSCPCCQKDFVPSISVEKANTDSMQNMFDCPHCQSVLKWENNKIKIIHTADPEEPQKLDSPVEATLQTVVDSATNNEASNEVITEPVNKLDNLIAEPSHMEPSHMKQAPSEPDESIAEPSHMEQAPSEPDESIAEPLYTEQSSNESDEPVVDEENNKKFEFNESPPEEELKQKKPTLEAIQEPMNKEEPDTPSLTNFHLSNEEEVIDSPNTPENFSDVENYGNSEDATDKGFLHYDVTIKGIDSAEIEQQVLSILEDPRFNWMAKDMLSLQKDGVLVLKKLNPVKAMCLISELSFLPVTLNWKQYMAITEPQVETTTEGKSPENETADNLEEDTQE